MKKIVVVGDFNFSEQQSSRMAAVGDVVRVDIAKTAEEWLESVQGADVICSWGDYLPENLNRLENLLVTYPYTEIGSFDSEKLAEKGVFVANAKGGNRKSIAEWAVFMTLSLYRQFPAFLRTTTQHPFTSTESLEGQKVLVVGHGTIGTEIGERCQAFGMLVDYYNRCEDLVVKAAEADIVINSLNCNESSKNLLDAKFFAGMKHGAYYLTFARPFTYDIDGLIAAINAGVIVGAAIDCDPEPLFDISNDFYKKCMSNEKILVTPHVAGVTKQAATNGLEIMVQNVEKYLAGTPQNIVEK